MPKISNQIFNSSEDVLKSGFFSTLPMFNRILSFIKGYFNLQYIFYEVSKESPSSLRYFSMKTGLVEIGKTYRILPIRTHSQNVTPLIFNFNPT